MRGRKRRLRQRRPRRRTRVEEGMMCLVSEKQCVSWMGSEKSRVGMRAHMSNPPV